jgi:AcrR family transcriptional regulator
VSDTQARFQRRKDERPGEIVAAALEVFAEKGFALAKLDEVARRAGVSKGALYLYFDTKEDLFRAVVREAITPNVEGMRAMAEAYEGPFAELAPLLLERLVAVADNSTLPAVARMVIAESRTFPDLARTWHDSVVSQAVGIVAELIARAQARGEIRPGRPRFYAFSLIGPMLMGFLWRETFQPIGAEPIDLAGLAKQHVETVLNGMIAREDGA